MGKTKTTYTAVDVHDFLEAQAITAEKKSDSLQLISLLQEWTKEAPKMWGPSIIGFGNYHYKYQSGHEGDAPILAFSPRKPAISLYIYSDTEKSKTILPQLGNYKMGKACIYIKKLSDIDVAILKTLCLETIQYISTHHECSCHTQK